MLDFLRELHSSSGIMELIGTGGVFVVAAIVFAETGLLVGFFLPGDSLLITAGVLANPASSLHIPGVDILWLNLALVLAATIGNQTGYFLGTKVGNGIWEKPDGKLFKKKHLREAHDFYMKWGGPSVIAARYVPIFRTFVPFAAGLAKMPYKKFVMWDIPGGILWPTSLVWAGYYLPQEWTNRLDKLIVVVILVSVIPVGVGILKKTFFAKKLV